MAGASGQVTDTYAYDPFGNCVHTGVSTNPLQFSSERHDTETALVYYNYRHYGPSLGRWLSRDPIGEVGDEQLYRMIHNNCINLYDSLGEKSEECLFCGPDYTQVLADALNNALMKWAHDYGGYTDNLFRYFNYRLRFRWLAMLDIGSELDRPVIKKYDNKLGISCPSGEKCKRTYEICNVCVHDHFIGNILYGFWMKLFDFTKYTAHLGGHGYQYMSSGHEDYSYDQAGYELGFALFASDIYLFTKDSVCRIIEGHEAFARANNTGTDYTECSKCPLP
jgi:RHS repeat-associated protein